MAESMILDGKKVANEIYEKLTPIMENITGPKLIIVTTGDQDASKVYVNSKVKKCNALDIECQVIHYDFLNEEAIDDMLSEMHWFRFPPFIIQLPITGSVSKATIYNKMFKYMKEHNYIDPEERIARCDVDGLISAKNITFLERPEYIYGNSNPSLLHHINLPCTPLGIMTLLDYYQYFDNTVNKNVVIFGRSDLVGKPLERMLMDRDFTVTVCHSKSSNLTIDNAIYNSDLIISAIGNNDLLTYDYLSKFKGILSGKTMVDVGINRDTNGKLRGDCDPNALEWFGSYTPVPGGVGPMTVAMLMCNIVKFYQHSYDHDYIGTLQSIYPTKYTPINMNIYK